MQLRLHANMVDEQTSRIADALRMPFEELGTRLSGDYGGVMEHLWIDLELIEAFAKPDGSPRHPFRFQKRVSGRGHFGLPDQPDQFNVGHFSVRPDFSVLLALPAASVVPHVLRLVHQGTDVLVAKRKRLGGFDAARFRDRLATECQALGHDIGA